MERALIRPKLFLDTNICIYAANETIPRDEWRRVLKHIEAHYSYQVSFVTVKELFAKISRGGDNRFEENKKALRTLCEPPQLDFLPYPPVFAIRTVLGLPVARRSKFPEDQLYETVCKAILQCSSKAQLKAGVPYPGKPRGLFSFDLDHFDQHENRAQKEHLDLLLGMQAGRVETSDPMELAAFLLRDFGQAFDTASCSTLTNALSAVHTFSRNLGKLSKNKRAKLERRENDWGDIMQLYYLSDESMHFLTCDEKCRNQTQGSTQQNRILLYEEIVRSL
jgi:predicted nucleic acid-binding protein